MGAWLQKNFLNNPDGTVTIFVNVGQSLLFDPSDPNGLFSLITSTPPTYAELSSLPCVAQGWQKIFDQWKAKGLVS